MVCLMATRNRQKKRMQASVPGLAQAGVRNQCTRWRRLGPDGKFAEHLSPTNDCSIALRTVALRTVRKLLLREGISRHSEVTIPEFRGGSEIMANLPLVVYGCGTMGYPIIDAIRHSLREPDVLLVDDNQSLWGAEIYGYRIVAPLEALGKGPRRFICTIGDNHSRRRLLQQYQADGHTLFSVIHPSAIISPTASIGSGSYVMPLVVVNAEARVGEGCFLSSTAVVEHHCHVGDYTLLGPGVRMGGSVSIGSLTLVGLGSCIRPGITIGSRATIGAGAVVVRNVANGARVAGNPASPLSANHPAA